MCIFQVKAVYILHLFYYLYRYKCAIIISAIILQRRLTMKNIIRKLLIPTFTIFVFTFLFVTNIKAAVEKPVAPDNFNVTIDSLNEAAYLTWDYDSSVNPYVDGFYIYRSTSKNGTYEFLDEVYSYYSSDEYNMYDYDIEVGVTYYYKIAAYLEDYVDDDYYGYYDIIWGPEVLSDMVQIPLETPNLKSATPVQSRSMLLCWSPISYADGYYVYRSTNPNSGFTHIYTYKNSESSADNWYWDFYYSYENEYLSYTDKKLTVGQTYYYKVCPYVEYGNQIFTGTFSNVKYETARINYPKIKKGVSKKKSTNTITWKKSSGANGYVIYFSKKYNGKYKKLKTLKGSKKLTYTHKKLKNGVAYYYKVYAYKNINGKKLLSNEPEAYEKYCDYYTYADESYESRHKRIFGNKDISKYSSSKQAKKNMKTIKIKVWDINSNDKKYTRKFSITVHKNLAPSVKKMFKEIYKSKEKFPIHDIGAYSWRGDDSYSEHCIGTAFDINSNENYMIDGDTVLSGSLWKPKKNPYSIPLKCDLVKILEKYGFTRGFWGDRKDYMHFSYFGS